MDDLNPQFFKNYPDPQTAPMERSVSAPPILELSSNNLFAFRTDASTLFSDSRWNESYINFYSSYQQQQQQQQQMYANHFNNYQHFEPSFGFFPYSFDNEPHYQYPPKPDEEEQVVKRIFNERYQHDTTTHGARAEPIYNNNNNNNNDASTSYDETQGVWTPPNSLPKKLAHLCLDEFSLEDSLLPELGSDSEPFSSADDLIGLTPSAHKRNGMNPPAHLVQDHREAFSKMMRDDEKQNLGGFIPSNSVIGSKIHPQQKVDPKDVIKMQPKHPMAQKVKQYAPKKSQLQPQLQAQQPPQLSAHLHDTPKNHHLPTQPSPIQPKPQLLSLHPKAPIKVTSDPGTKQPESALNKTKQQKQVVPEVPAAAAAADDLSAFRFTSFDQVVGQIYSLCKDQHGCRFLQKKLEENNPQVADIIFNEIIEYIVELMTDPFGNYLCQKLLEYCRDFQRLTIIEHVSKEMVSISQNMHGTRAIQKMIEYLNSPEQVNLIINALKDSVVLLIQDLNGNHVIQRCLNRLSSKDNQFIYDAVAANCVEVATHRHGCCVLQRCIDHASENQKVQLVNEITVNALELVQDPYGNYVVQYVLDLQKEKYSHFASALIKRFGGHLTELSTQKFSSNVIEKCLNVAEPKTRAWMINEFLEADNLLVMLQDPFANYVIQTSLNVSEPEQHTRLVESIRPHLALLRNTPYGKRIQNKILKEKEMMDRARKKMG